MNESPRPRLLYIAHQYENRGGVELLTQSLVHGLRERYEIFVLYPSPDSLTLRNEAGRTTLYPADKLGWVATPYRAPRTEQSLGEILAVVRPQLIHLQHFLSWPLSVIDHAVASGVPVAISFHDFYAITPHFTMQGVRSSEQTFTPEFSQAAFGTDLTAYLAERRTLLTASLAKVQARIAVSPFLVRELSRIYPLEYRVIENGIEPFDPVPARPPGSGLRFGYIGSLIAQKGWKPLYDAFADVRRRHPSAELHLYGGPMPSVPVQEGVMFHGPYGLQDLPRIAAEIDVGVIPSIFPETYSLVLSELWQANRPVAASAIGALGERIQDGVNGKLFPPGDLRSIADTLCWFLEQEEWRAWELPRPRERSAMIAEHEALYRELLAAKPAIEPDPEQKTTAASTPPPNMLVVQLCDFVDDGDRYYRYLMPSRHLARLPGVTVMDCHYLHRHLPAVVEAADVLVLQFVYDWDLLALIERRRAAGKITVFEANDYFYDVQPWNPIAERWQDRAVREAFRHFIRTADAVQTSSDWLAGKWREWNDRVFVFENQLAEVTPLKRPPTRPLTIGWGGSPGHFADWFNVAPLLQKWLDRRPGVHLSVMTQEFARPFFNLPPDRYHFTRFGTMGEYRHFLASLDIGLAPLLPSDYNRGRSDVKFLEFASSGVAGIYPDLDPYRGKIADGETGLVYRNAKELIECLDCLADDGPLRGRIRQQAHAHVTTTRLIGQHIGERLECYRSLLRGPARGGPLPANVLAAAERDGSYLRMPSQQAENTLASVQGTSTPEMATALVRIIQQVPEYVAAYQQLGRVRNDLRDNAGALAVLERANQLQPQRAATLCEMARSVFGLGDSARARALMEEALALNPLFHPGWQYMLRLLALRRDADGPRWAERVRLHFPNSYRLALAGQALYPPPAGVTVLHGLLDEFAPGFSHEERPVAAAAFGEVIATTAQQRPDDPNVLKLLRRACEVFPESVRLANELAAVLRRTGDDAGSIAHFARGHSLRRDAITFKEEFAKDDGSVLLWQFAEHIRRWTADPTR